MKKLNMEISEVLKKKIKHSNKSIKVKSPVQRILINKDTGEQVVQG